MGAVELAMRACILASRHGGAMCFGESSSSDHFGASQYGAKRKCARRSRREAATTTTIVPQKAIGHRFAAALDLWVQYHMSSIMSECLMETAGPAPSSSLTRAACSPLLTRKSWSSLYISYLFISLCFNRLDRVSFLSCSSPDYLTVMLQAYTYKAWRMPAWQIPVESTHGARTNGKCKKLYLLPFVVEEVVPPTAVMALLLRNLEVCPSCPSAEHASPQTLCASTYNSMLPSQIGNSIQWRLALDVVADSRREV
jgi:hypothetical protein